MQEERDMVLAGSPNDAVSRVLTEGVFVFLAGFAIGVALFFIVYGARVLDFTYDNWILSIPDPDIVQHYVGWCAYRGSPWSYPPGLTDALSYPFPMSILWSDSIPVFAIFFKLFSRFLPTTCQYLGFYGALSMGLTGGFSSLLIRKVTESLPLSLIGAIPFTLNYPLLHRMFYHTSLVAQWIILAALLLWLGNYGKRVRFAGFTALSFFAVLIHPYLWAMSAIIFLFCEFDEVTEIGLPGEGNSPASSGVSARKEFGRPILRNALRQLPEAASFFVAAYLGLYMEGAFYGNVKTDYGLGGFNSNLNSLFNPALMQGFLPSLPTLENQYEGFGYLGAGMLAFMLITGLVLAVNRTTLRFTHGTVDTSHTPGNTHTPDEKEIKKFVISKKRLILLFIMILAFSAIAVFPDLYLGTTKIFHMPYPAKFGELMGIFRANGRFIWCAIFTIELLSMYAASRLFKENTAALILSACVLLQLFEMSGEISIRHERFSRQYDPIHQDLENRDLLAVIDRYEHMVSEDMNVLELQKLAYFASNHGLTVNRYYFARGRDDEVGAYYQEEKERVRTGNADPGTIYVINRGSFPEWDAYDVYIYDLTGTFIAVTEEIPGLVRIGGLAGY